MAYVSQESICKTLITDANKAMKKGEFYEAERLLLEALHRVEDATGPVHPRMGAVLIRLGDFYRNQSKLDVAESQFRRALAIYQGAFGDDNFDVAICLQHLAEVLTAQRRTGEAEQYRMRSNSILRQRLHKFEFRPTDKAS